MDESLRTNDPVTQAVSRYADMLVRVCFTYMKNIQDAEEITQETFLKLMEKQPVFQNEPEGVVAAGCYQSVQKPPQIILVSKNPVFGRNRHPLYTRRKQCVECGTATARQISERDPPVLH